MWRRLKDITCPTCGKMFHPRYYGRVYCCRECLKNRGRIKLICKFCGKEFYRNKSDIRCKNNFCSINCAKNGHDKRKRTFLICKQCGKSFYFGSLKRKFCSSKCYFEWFQRENTSNWKGGKSSEYEKLKRSKEWKLWRKAVFERDNYTCQICHFRSGKGKHHIDLHPHHLESASKYPEFRLCLDNGLTVCANCHGKIHSINFRNRKY
jgi:hypothetical protein